MIALEFWSQNLTFFFIDSLVPWSEKHKRNSKCINSHLICKLLNMKKFLGKPKLLKFLILSQGFAFTLKLTTISKVFAAFSAWLSEELCPREMVALAMTPKSQKPSPFGFTAITQEKEENLPQWYPPSNVLNHPNLTLPASHWKNSTAFMLWKIRRIGPDHISVFKCGSLSI